MHLKVQGDIMQQAITTLFVALMTVLAPKYEP